MDNHIASFLERAGIAKATVTPLAADMSSRKYSRVKVSTDSFVLMATTQPEPDIRQFSRIAGVLRGLELSAPVIHHAEPEIGLALLEDFGDNTFNRMLIAGHDSQTLYQLASDVLIHIHVQFHPSMMDFPVPVYDKTLFLEQVSLFSQIVLPHLSPTALNAFIQAWDSILPLALKGPQSLLLRDYHVDNLMLLSDRVGVKACGLLDFELAGLGPVSYDLVSLLEDARRDVPMPLAQAMIQHYLAACPHVSRTDFEMSYAILGALRHTRIIGIFIRQIVQFNRKQYAAFLPRVWTYLDRHLQNPVLAPVKTWFDEHVPAEVRQPYGGNDFKEK